MDPITRLFNLILKVNEHASNVKFVAMEYLDIYIYMYMYDTY